MQGFLQRYGTFVTGVLSGLDRVLFRGTNRMLSTARGMMNYLWHHQILLKDFGEYSESVSQEVRRESQAVMEAQGCEYQFLSDAGVRKEEVARQVALERGITTGPVCLLGAVEPCMSFQVSRNRQLKKLVLSPRWRKCLHLYHYHLHERFGLLHVRLQTWFPFGMRVCLNGREWLCRSLEREGIAHQREDNCLVALADYARGQALLEEQLTVNWPEVLSELGGRANPGVARRVQWAGAGMEYYWSAEESEWATDVVFEDPGKLAGLYEQWTRGSVLGMGCDQVLRFLGKRRHYEGELLTDLRRRSEGLRVKHWAGKNSIKMYDKQGRMLRVETTINDPSDFRVFRGSERDSEKKCWRSLRKGVADFHRRGVVSQAANERYLEQLSTVETGQTVSQALWPLGQRVCKDGRRYRGLRVMDAADGALLSAVGRGEHAINGFRNGDIRAALFGGDPKSQEERRRPSAQVSRKLGMLRAHGLIAKVPKTRRWILTAKGREVTMLLGAASHARTSELLKAA
jgi:hypothetical protein